MTTTKATMDTNPTRFSNGIPDNLLDAIKNINTAIIIDMKTHDTMPNHLAAFCGVSGDSNNRHSNQFHQPLELLLSGAINNTLHSVIYICMYGVLINIQARARVFTLHYGQILYTE